MSDKFEEMAEQLTDNNAFGAIGFTYNSNNIEDSTLSLGDTALLYDGVQVDGPAEDIRQAEGGFAAHMTIDSPEPDDSSKNLTIEAMIVASGFNANTKRNMLQLHDKLASNRGFGRKEVVAVLGGSNSGAGDLLKKMLDVGIITTVSGKGKGCYTFTGG